MSPSLSRNLFKVVSPILLVIFLISLFGSASAASSPSQSPSVETELICHTDNPAECYPKVFSATDEFQIIRDDQDLPPGLHVQLDMQTGQKQAKLYNPNEDENPALAGLPVDQAVMVIDPEPSQGEPQIPSGAPAYEPVGAVKEPREKDEGYTEALQTMKDYSENPHSFESSPLDEALQTLEDLSHDMYYGLQIAGDTEALQALLCLLTKRDVVQAEARQLTDRHDFLASSTLASAVRNNAPALQALEKSWDAVMEKQCHFHSQPLRHELYHKLAPTTEPGSKGESLEADFIGRNLAALPGLLKSPKIRAEFLENDGMRSFLKILLREGADWDPRRPKVASIVSDTFLDEALGASLGIWPTRGPADASVCAAGGPECLDEGCWEYHLEKMSGDPQWSRELLLLLKQGRPDGSEAATPPIHNEL
ncbi:Uu.00g039510.m01.CDS01 [Anthostomella pinea]|uniref:Nucleotide exchange factor SIL1 n=1 Tax=Anthostomella pinea TaxID=933095 RepID=A0AAI8V527_9PEZI|nr:Uu.00g039510.m01.CDS01 [Anthostomella pinea]